MRFLLPLALAALPATSIAADTPHRPLRPKGLEQLGPWRSDCPPTAAQQVAKQVQQEPGAPLVHRLVDLPSATAYAAVFREVNGCEAPLTMTEYRKASPR